MDCIFCKIANKEIPSNTLYEDDKVLVIMDINPTCDGHCLVIPKNHIETVYDVNSDILNHMFEVARGIAKTEMKVLNEDGCSFSINYGSKQMVKHLHLHILPNFEKAPSLTVNEVFDKLKGEI